MKLTERQVEIRGAFRSAVLDLFWDDHRVLMFNVTRIIAAKFFDNDESAAMDALAEIPSIRIYNQKGPIQGWLARHFRAVSNAMFDKKPVDYCLALWKTQKYAANMNSKRSKQDMKEHAALQRNNRVNRAYAELRKNMPDRWAKSDWTKVK